MTTPYNADEAARLLKASRGLFFSDDDIDAMADQLEAAQHRIAEQDEEIHALRVRLDRASKLAGLWTGQAGKACQTCGGNLYEHVGTDLHCPERPAKHDALTALADQLEAR